MATAKDLEIATQPKSDQLNSIDLMGVNKTIVISSVDINNKSIAQKITVHYIGGEGKPWKPSKGMARVLKVLISPEPDNWIGESVELCRNPEVKYSGEEVGGIEIFGLSSIQKPVMVDVVVSKGKIKKIKVVPIKNNIAAPVIAKTENTQNKNPNLRVIAEKLQASSKLGTEDFEKELLLVSDSDRAEMRDWIIKCATYAQKVDYERFTNEINTD
jgi:hypothetical protein